MKWVLTPDEFTHVWENETNLDRRPYPINLARANTVRTEKEYAALRLAQRFGKQADADLAAALTLCARADATTVTVSGVRTRPPRNGSGPEDERILAFAAAVHKHAGILVATPERVTVRMCHINALGQLLVQIIGPARAGRVGPLREPQDAVLTPLGAQEPPSANGTRGAARFRQMLCKPVDGRGFITVTVEPENPMSPPTRHRTWLDFTGDGRYLLTTAQDMVLTPVSDPEFAAELLRMAHIC
ncbi:MULTISPECIES: ESX secretion-associated protein EspG [unclassified Nocardia]|uniref:ESX secretion-associated protein EspG n=1 Tax=unclassified Nocardia TaxID=2637762 RepID=UPI001CE40668|nr:MULTISPECIES: ESX secretion-associated protein EspG [unclassified Nocardia]